MHFIDFRIGWYGLDAVTPNRETTSGVGKAESGEANDTYVDIDGYVGSEDESSNPAYSTQPDPIYNRIEEEVTDVSMKLLERLHLVQIWVFQTCLTVLIINWQNQKRAKTI